MTTITIELCAEDRARLDKIIDCLGVQTECAHCAQLVTQVVNNITRELGLPGTGVVTRNQPTAPPAPVLKEAAAITPAKEEKPAQPATEAPAEAPSVDVLLAKVRELVKAGKREQVKTIVEGYAPSVSEIPEGKRAEALKWLEALEKGI